MENYAIIATGVELMRFQACISAATLVAPGSEFEVARKFFPLGPCPDWGLPGSGEDETERRWRRVSGLIGKLCYLGLRGVEVGSTSYLWSI
jgi:hypothetical protein